MGGSTHCRDPLTPGGRRVFGLIMLERSKQYLEAMVQCGIFFASGCPCIHHNNPHGYDVCVFAGRDMVPLHARPDFETLGNKQFLAIANRELDVGVAAPAPATPPPPPPRRGAAPPQPPQLATPAAAAAPPPPAPPPATTNTLTPGIAACGRVVASWGACHRAVSTSRLARPDHCFGG